MQTAITATPSAVIPGQRRAVGDMVFAGAARASGGLVLLLLGGIILSLFIGGMGAFRAFGPGFITSAVWNPVTQKFGGLVSIYGTLVTSVIALVLAVPLAFGIAFYLTELAPGWLRRPVGTAIELLAAMPSIIYGMWGFFVIVPIMSTTIQPAVIDAFDGIPVLQDLFAGPPFGTGIFTAGLVLAVMVIPFIAATMRDVFVTVPAVYKESAYGVGCTTWEVMRSIVLPYTRDLGGRRHHAGPGPRAGRDHGGDLRHRQRQPDLGVRCSAPAIPSPRSSRWNSRKARPAA